MGGIHLYAQNHFIQWLQNEKRGRCTFDKATTEMLIENYYLGNSGKTKYAGWILFPYIDFEGRLRDIKIMDYNSDTGKRIKEPYCKCWFMGKEILKNASAKTERCFFGEHLLRGNKKPIKIFESEASAIYAAPFYTDCVCIATGGTNGCKWTEKEKCQVLQERQVILYPDIDAYESWTQKAKILKGYGIDVQVSQLIKKLALKFASKNDVAYSELEKGKFDLRDILKYKILQDFVKPLIEELSNDDPVVALFETHTGKQFDNMILAYIKTEDRNHYDLLFDNEGYPVTKQSDKVKMLEIFYKKKFTEIKFNGVKYLGNICDAGNE